VLDTDGLPMPEGDEKNEVGAACAFLSYKNSLEILL